ncbi:MAG TPA: PqqD family protein [Kiritimatiellia bacterium]|nr:PqqD family protein [Kiritimatiellia bacterium]
MEKRIYRENPNMVARRIRGESILIPVAGTMDQLDSIISLNEWAEYIRKKATEGLDAQGIAEELTREYDVGIETARKDVDAVLGELEQIGVLLPVEQS